MFYFTNPSHIIALVSNNEPNIYINCIDKNISLLTCFVTGSAMRSLNS